MKARLLLLPLLLCSLGARAEVLVEQAYVRGLPPGVDNTAAYMTLRNTGSEEVELVGATSPVAEQVMLHSTAEHEGMMHMEHQESAVIPAGGELKLESGGMHLMLMKLKEHPSPGEQVQLTLNFADGASKTLQAQVRSVLDE